METIGGKLAVQPDGQISSLEWDGEVIVIRQYLKWLMT